MPAQVAYQPVGTLGVAAMLRQRFEPAVERLFLGERQQCSCKGMRKGLVDQVVRVEQLTDVARRDVRTNIVGMLEELDRGQMKFTLQKLRPHFDRPLQSGRVGSVSGEISRGRVTQHDDLLSRGGNISDQWTVPVDFMQPDAHGGELKAVAEQSAVMDLLKCLMDFRARRVRPVEQQSAIVCPELGIACHRLAVEIHVVGS